MTAVKLIAVAVVAALCLAAGVSAEMETAGRNLACGAKGGVCEAASGCGGRGVAGLCDGVDDDVVCCIPKKGPKKLSAAEKAARAAAKKAKALKKQRKHSKKVTKKMDAQKSKEGAKLADAAADAEAAKKAAKAKADQSKPEQISNKQMAKASQRKLIEPANADEKDGAAAPKPPAAAVKKHHKKHGKKHHKKGKKHAKKHDKKHGKKHGKHAKKAKKAKKAFKLKKGARGIDVAQKTTKKQWKCLKNAGWKWAVVRGFRGSNKADAHAARNLKNARKAGFRRSQLGVYMYPCARCGKPKEQLKRMFSQLKRQGAHKAFKNIWIDVEGDFWPTRKPRSKADRQKEAAAARAAANRAAFYSSVGAKPPAAPVTAPAAAAATAPKPAVKGAKKHGKKHGRHHKSRRFVRALLKECAKHKGYRCGVYTTAKDWRKIMGKKAVKLPKGTPLWYADANVEQPSASTKGFTPFNAWKKPFAKQYSQNQNVCGMSVDVNVRA